nr:MAG TPA: nucelotide kinase [Caudoviricetes sp.]
MAKTLSNDVDQNVQHPIYYGGADDPYEAIKVIEAWNLGFHLGNTVKYISRAGKKDGNSATQDLKKALFYLNREIELLEKQDQVIDVSDAMVNDTVSAGTK